MKKRTYLDANAGAPLLDEVRDAMVAAMAYVANPSSVHAEGREARRLIETARSRIAASTGARAENVILTSGGTEAAALALTPQFISGRKNVVFGRLYVGATEHPCVWAGGRFPSGMITRIPVDSDGVVDLAVLRQTLSRHDYSEGPPLVALMLANNESGALNPIAAASSLVKRHGGFLFCDAVQGFGRIPVSIAELGADAISLSAHKVGGPQGAGALILADGDFRPVPIAGGGGQERGRRSGTENLIGIVGFGVAAAVAPSYVQEADGTEALRAKLEAGILLVSPEARIMSAGSPRVPNTTLFVAPGVAAETAVIALDLEGVAVSAGSACSSGKVGPSRVLEAMGESPEASRSGIRVSLLPTARETDVEIFVEAWRAVHGRMSRSRAA